MDKKERRPILYRGEIYSKKISKKTWGDLKKPESSYNEARIKIISDIKRTKRAIDKIPEEYKLPNEFVVSMRLESGFSAKSYYPSSLFDSTRTVLGVRDIGSRIWKNKKENGKIIFVRTTKQGLDYLENKLNKNESQVSKAFAMDIRKLKDINLLESDEQIQGIPDKWKEGNLEAVLHPFEKDKKIAIDKFIELLKNAGADISKLKLKQYETGITFVSLYGNRKILKKILGYNPLRMIHTLSLRSLPVQRVAIKDSAPLPPEDQNASPVILGIFDSGVQKDNKYISPYTKTVSLIRMNISEEEDDVLHGTLVTGAALYGPINDYGPKDILPKPLISVKNFRVFPVSSDDDTDLYEIIDVIEETIPKEKEIFVYNISFGPVGPILDDHISRFTFACDLLSARYGVLFCTAVGNDGDVDPEYMRRIQSPSDMVNGLAVGAYTERHGKFVRAPYSCIGPGREGNKMKPDICAFGGCDNSPMHLISTHDGNKDSTCGTSFASPIVASLATQLIGYSNGSIDSLVARALIIHTSENIDESGYNFEIGHGLLNRSINKIITCNSNSFTLIYRGELEFGKFTEFKIPWDNDIIEGKAKLKWTTVVVSGIDPQSPDDYTTGSVMVSLLPNYNKFIFIKDKKTKTLDIIKDKNEILELEKNGWIKSSFPVNGAGEKTYQTEDELRAGMKWDTVDCRSENKLCNNIFNPAFHVHALSRGKRYIGKKIKFALIVSVELSRQDIDLYSNILNKFESLIPINLQLNNIINIKNNG